MRYIFRNRFGPASACMNQCLPGKLLFLGEKESVQQILVIGYGNPLRGDDGFGSLAANNVEERQIPGVEVIVSHQLNPELAAFLSESGHAIFLDAVPGDDPEPQRNAGRASAICHLPERIISSRATCWRWRRPSMERRHRQP